MSDYIELHVCEQPQIELEVKEQIVIGGGGIIPTGTKTINVNSNGTTTEDVTTYASAQIVANVPNSYSAGDEGKVVENGALVSQGSAEYTSNGTYDTTKISSVEVSVSGSSPSGTKEISISQNGTTTENVAAYASAEITVNVPNTYAAGDEGKVVSNGALVAQTSDTVTQNGTVDTTLINSLTVAVSGGGGSSGGLANMVDVSTQQYQFAYMLMCMKKGDTKGGTATWTTAFPDTDTKIIETGLTTIHGFMLVNVERDYHINNGNNQTQDILYVFVNTDDTYNAFGCTAQATGSMATVINLTQGVSSNSAPLNGAFTFNGGDIYYKGRYNQNASYQIVKTNMQYEWLAW